MKDHLFLLERALRKIFEKLKKRIPEKEKVGVMVSGGIDSSVIAKLASKHFPNLYLLSCGTSKGKDLAFVNLLQKYLQKPLFYLKISEEEVKHNLSLIKNLLEKEGLEPSLINLSLALCFFLVLKMGKEKGVTWVLTGQGPDDLLAGYTKYKNVSFKKLDEEIKKGLLKALKIDKKRDNLIARFLKVNLFHPYLEKEFVKASFAIPPNLKLFKRKDEVIEKYILRRLGEKLGLPEKICWRKKIAFQYSTRMQKIVKRLSHHSGPESE